MLGKTGLSPREHQDLARHSTYTLTSRYTHSTLYDLGQAVQAHPSMVQCKNAQILAATGTEGRKTLAQSLAQTLGREGGFRGISRDELGWTTPG
jgi:hypothetical protein